MIAYVPLIAALVGLLLYGFAHGSKIQEVGRLTFFAGLLVFLMTQAHHVLRLAGK